MQPLLLASLNDALNLLGIRIIEVGEQWSVSEGKALIRFSDNVVSLAFTDLSWVFPQDPASSVIWVAVLLCLLSLESWLAKEQEKTPQGASQVS